MLLSKSSVEDTILYYKLKQENKVDSSFTFESTTIDGIRAIAFGRGDSVTKINKIKDLLTYLNIIKPHKG